MRRIRLVFGTRKRGDFNVTSVLPQSVVDEAEKFVQINRPFPVRPESAAALREFETRFGFSLAATCLHPRLRQLLNTGLAAPPEDDGVDAAMMEHVAADFEGE